MLLRPNHAHALITAAMLVTAFTGTGASAGTGGWHNGSWYGDNETPVPSSRPITAEDHGSPGPGEGQSYQPRYDEVRHDEREFAQPGRDAWLADCRSRVRSRDNGVDGAVIGGVIGGAAGNRIAGRHNRTVGTVAGAALGAVAGSAVDRAEDRGRTRDECEAYLDDYYARYSAYASQGYAQPGYPMRYAPAYGYQGNGGCCGQTPAVMAPAQPRPDCTETIEYVYEDVPVRPSARPVPRRSKIVPDKRIRIVPDKRTRVK